MHKGNKQGDDHPSGEHNHEGRPDRLGNGAENTRQMVQAPVRITHRPSLSPGGQLGWGFRHPQVLGSWIVHPSAGMVTSGSVHNLRSTTLRLVELINLPDFGPDDYAQIVDGEKVPYGTDHLEDCLAGQERPRRAVGGRSPHRSRGLDPGPGARGHRDRFYPLPEYPHLLREFFDHGEWTCRQ